VQTEGAEVELLLSRAQSGSQEAITALVRCHSDALLRVIERRLNKRLRTLIDPSDIAQETWAVVFLDGLKKISSDPDKFLAFVIRTAINKVHEAHRHHLDAAKRDHRRVCLLSGVPDSQLPAACSLDPVQSVLLADMERKRPQVIP
jgi:RNA polymerase sigma-70 factor (ECF subfamily)